MHRKDNLYFYKMYETIFFNNTRRNLLDPKVLVGAVSLLESSYPRFAVLSGVAQIASGENRYSPLSYCTTCAWKRRCIVTCC